MLARLKRAAKWRLELATGTTSRCRLLCKPLTMTGLRVRRLST